MLKLANANDRRHCLSLLALQLLRTMGETIAYLYAFVQGVVTADQTNDLYGPIGVYRTVIDHIRSLPANPTLAVMDAECWQVRRQAAPDSRRRMAISGPADRCRRERRGMVGWIDSRRSWAVMTVPWRAANESSMQSDPRLRRRWPVPSMAERDRAAGPTRKVVYRSRQWYNWSGRKREYQNDLTARF